jgi:serine/threonine protein kinase
MGCVQGCNRNDIKITINKSSTKPSVINKVVKEIKINNDLFISEKLTKFEDNYITLKELGEGSFGKVFKVKHKSTGSIRAVKMIFKQRILMSKFEEEEIIKEINILKLLDHPNIIKVYEYFNTKENLYIILEYCNGGELFDKLIEYSSFPEDITADIMRQLLSAVCFCHSRNIIHRDIKPENILIESYEPKLSKKKTAMINLAAPTAVFKNSSNINLNLKSQKTITDNAITIKGLDKDDIIRTKVKKEEEESKNNKYLEKFTVKIIDFGTSVIKKGDIKEKTGTAYYIAPEVIKNNYNEKCDIWSLGVIMYILLSGEPPFSDDDDNVIFKKIVIGKYKLSGKNWDKISTEAKDLIKKLLTYNYLERPSAAQILEKDPWLKKYGNNDDSDRLDMKGTLLSLRKRKNNKKLQQATLGFIVHHLSNDSEVDRLRKIFQIIDTNGDGQLTKEELYEGIKNQFGQEIADLEINKIMIALDNDNSGIIEFQEFLRACIDKSKIFTEDNLKQAFQLFDIDRSGKITFDEIKAVLGKNLKEVDDDVWKEMVNEVDKHKSDGITIVDFKNMMLDMDKSVQELNDSVL